MRRFIARVLGTLSLGAVLAVGVGATAAAADTPSPGASNVVAGTVVAGPAPQARSASDWWW